MVRVVLLFAPLLIPLGCAGRSSRTLYEYRLHTTAEMYFDWACEGVYRTDFSVVDRDAGIGWLIHQELGEHEAAEALASINTRINQLAAEGWEIASLNREGLLLRRPAGSEISRSGDLPPLRGSPSQGVSGDAPHALFFSCE